MPLPCPAQLSLRFHALHVVIIFCAILPDLSIHISRDNQSLTLGTSCILVFNCVQKSSMSCSVLPVFYHLVCEINLGRITIFSLTRFNKIAIQGAPQMAVDKEAIS